MGVIIDHAPLPERDTLTGKIEGLAVGESLLAPSKSRSTLATLASRVQAAHAGRRYRTAETADGPRVWRVA